MANLKEIRGRITSISSTMQITSAMKMVSAAKLKKATDAIVMLRPYSEKLQEIIANVSSTTDLEGVSMYTAEREVKNSAASNKVIFLPLILSSLNLFKYSDSNFLRNTTIETVAEKERIKPASNNLFVSYMRISIAAMPIRL